MTVGAIAAPQFVAKTDPKTKEFLSSQEVTYEELDAYVQEKSKLKGMVAYSMSKAALHKYVEVLARENSHL